MEFRYRIGEDRDPSLLLRRSSSSSVSGAPPLRGGLGGLIAGGAETVRAADFMRRPVSGSLALRRELQKELIRQEIIAQEMAEQERIRQEMISSDNGRIRQETIAQEMVVRRELEEEVRREMAMEQAMEMERLRREMEVERALREAEIHRAIGVQRAPFVGQLVPPPPEAMPMERLRPGTFQRHSEFGVRNELPPWVNPRSRARYETSIVQDDNVSEIDESLSAEEVKLFNLERPDIKRKGPVVAGSSKIARVDKHRVPKERTYTGSKLTILVDGKPHQVMKNNRALLCEICGVTCYHTTVMATHLAGKKHVARVGDLSNGAST